MDKADKERGARLREAREAAGLAHYSELATMIGRHHMSVWKHERGDPIGKATLRLYADTLRVSEEWIEYGFGQGPPRKGPGIVEEYIASPVGTSANEDIKQLLRSFPYASTGVRNLTPLIVHQIRKTLETVRAAERNSANAHARSRT